MSVILIKGKASNQTYFSLFLEKIRYKLYIDRRNNFASIFDKHIAKENWCPSITEHRLVLIRNTTSTKHYVEKQKV